MAAQARWKKGEVPWSRTGPAPGRFAPAVDTTDSSSQWARRFKQAAPRLRDDDVRRLRSRLAADVDEEPSTRSVHMLETVIAELERRARVAQQKAAQWNAYDDLVAGGTEPEQAYVEAFGTPARGRGRGPTLRELRADWENVVEAEYLQAEEACQGQLTTPAGRARRISPRRFWRSPPAYVNRWASDEFKQWAAGRGGITTWAVFQAQYGRGGSVGETRQRARGSMGEWR